jgi:hypothetical protein
VKKWPYSYKNVGLLNVWQERQMLMFTRNATKALDKRNFKFF